MPFVTKHVHIVPEGFLPEKRLFVMLVPYFFLLFCPVKIFDVCFPLSGSSIFFAEGKHTQSLIGVTIIYLVFHLAQNFLVCGAVKRMIFGIITCVVQILFVYSSISL